MSSVLFSNFISADVLQETKLKPWYETVRGYLVFTNVLVSIYMVYDVKSDSLLNCVSANVSVEFAASTTTYANCYCSAQLLQWHQRNFNLVCLLCSLAIYFSYCWWLLIPNVKESFVLIRECDDALKDLKGTPSDLRAILRLYYSKSKPNKEFSKDEMPKLIVVSHRLWCGHSGMTNIFKIYRLRNAISCTILVGVFTIIVVCLSINETDNPANCQLDILSGAHVHCFIHTKDRLFPFVIAILVVTFALCIGTFSLLFAINNEIGTTIDVENRESKATSTRMQDFESKWDGKGLSAKDLKIIRHGEDCNRFAEIFSKSATQFSKNTKILMYFSSVINPEGEQHCPDRFISFADKMENENILNVIAQDQNRDSNTEIFREIRALHGEIRKGRNFHDFLRKHEETFNKRFDHSEQGIGDDAYQCKSLFAGHISLDGRGTSLMWHAFSDLDGDYKQYLAAHLVLSGMDGAESSRVTKSNRIFAESSKEYLDRGSSAAHLNVRKKDQLNNVLTKVKNFRPQGPWSCDDEPGDEGGEQAHETAQLL